MNKAIDGRNRVGNSVDRGSISNMRLDQSSADGRVTIFYGQYTVNGAQSGWTRASYVDGQFS